TPRPGPFAEQLAGGEDLERDEAAVVLAEPPAPQRWPSLLEDARDRRGRLERWAEGGAAGRAASYLIAPSRAASVPASSSHTTRPLASSSASQPRAGQSPQRSR